MDIDNIKEKINLRLIKEEDVPEVVKNAISSFGFADIAYKEKHYRNHIKVFPEGQVCVEYNGKIIGSSSSLIINYADFGHNHTFEDISTDGFIFKHTYEGQNLYGIDVVVHPEYRNLKIGRLLYGERQRLCKAFNLESIIIGGRLPNYHKYANKYSAKEYVSLVEQGELFDPVLVFQLKNGFEVKDVKSEYLEDDKDSLEYASIMEWKNPGYKAWLPIKEAVLKHSISTLENFKKDCQLRMQWNRTKVDYLTTCFKFTLLNYLIKEGFLLLESLLLIHKELFNIEEFLIA